MNEKLRVLVFAGVFALAGCASPVAPESTDGATEGVVEENVETSEALQAPEAEEFPQPQISAAFDSPWPTGFTRRELADTALAKTYAFLDTRSDTGADQFLSIVYQDTVLEVHQEWSTDLATVTIDGFSDYLDEEILLVAGTEGDFFAETLAGTDRPLMPGFEQCCSSGIIGIAHKGSSWASLPKDFTREYPPIAPHMAIIPHELFHNVQDSLDKGPAGQTLPPGNPLYRPVWLIEGSAEYMGLALVSYRGYHEYWGNHFNTSVADAAAEDLGLSRYEIYEGSIDPYNYGGLATEYIIASLGVGPLLDVFRYAGEGSSFEEAFEKAIGLSVEEFYEAFDTMNVELLRD
jgi:hypothetical protein